MSRKRSANRRVADFTRTLVDETGRAVSSCLGIDGAASQLVAEMVARAVISAFSGQIVYVPVEFSMGVPECYRAIWDAFDGSNQNELATRFHCSVQNIYRVIEAMRAWEKEQRQGRLEL